MEILEEKLYFYGGAGRIKKPENLFFFFFFFFFFLILELFIETFCAKIRTKIL